MKTKILLALSLLITSNARAQVVLDIDSAVSRALDNNLSLHRSQIDTAAARRRYDRSWNTLIPSLGVGAMVAHPTSITHPVPPPQNVWTPGFNMSASLTLSPAIFAAIGQTREEYEAGLISYEAARQDLEFQVRRLYYQILLLKANAQLADLNMESAESRHQQTLTLQQAGRASSLDELSSRLDLQTQRTNAQNVLAQYNNALDSLKHILMIPMEEVIILEGNLLDFIGIEPTAANLTGGASMQVHALRQSIAVIEAQQRAARLRSYSPALSLSWNSTPMYIEQMGEWRDGSGQFSVSLSFRLDNYLPFSPAKEQIDSLGDVIAKQQSLLTEAAINHQNTVQRLLRDIARSGETIENLLLNITLAEETLRMSEQAYSSGVLDLQSLNNTRDNLRAAQNRLLSEQFNLLSAILELERELSLPFGSIAGVH